MSENNFICPFVQLDTTVQVRLNEGSNSSALVYLPGLHGDWTLVSSFRAALKGRVRFVEVAYPRTTVWSLEDYVDGVTKALVAKGIRHGWVLAESYGSQIAWGMLEMSQHRNFEMQGLVLAGGFVRHPMIAAVHLAQQVNRAIPMWLVKLFCKVYAGYANFRHRRAAETLSSISEFVKNRTVESDRKAICHRYNIISGNDLRAIACQATVPVYQLCGFFDPIVPWPFVRLWLKKNCPGFREWKLVWRADHNVLGTAPQVCAELVLKWMGSESYPVQ